MLTKNTLYTVSKLDKKSHTLQEGHFRQNNKMRKCELRECDLFSRTSIIQRQQQSHAN